MPNIFYSKPRVFNIAIAGNLLEFVIGRCRKVSAQFLQQIKSFSVYQIVSILGKITEIEGVPGNKVRSIAHIDFKQSLDLAVLGTFVS